MADRLRQPTYTDLLCNNRFAIRLKDCMQQSQLKVTHANIIDHNMVKLCSLYDIVQVVVTNSNSIAPTCKPQGLWVCPSGLQYRQKPCKLHHHAGSIQTLDWTGLDWNGMDFDPPPYLLYCAAATGRWGRGTIPFLAPSTIVLPEPWISINTYY